MSRASGTAFVFSTILHAGVLGGLALMAVVPSCSEKEPTPLVFEMVSMADAPTPANTPQPQATMPDLAAAEIPDLSELDLGEIPEITPPPVPKPTPPKTDAPKPTPQPKPKPLPKQSYEDFVRENPVEAPRPQPRPTQKPVVRPKIKTENIRRNLASIVVQRPGETAVPQMSATNQDQLAGYLASLRAKIDAAYRQPQGLGGQELVAIVEFTVTRTGQLTGVRIYQSSGNAIFDRSILDAFTRVGSAGTPPNGFSGVVRLPFEMKDV